MVESVTSPSAEQLERIVSEGLSAREVVIICAECEVEYDGRATGYLGPGERVILAKPDGTLLVHRPTGNDPVNWQPPGSTMTVELDLPSVVLTARRSNPEEIVTVHLKNASSVIRFPADDTAPLELSGTEAEMHDYVLQNPEEIESGLRVLEHERETPHGTIDVYANDQNGRPVVIEIKRRQASLAHVDQLARYMTRYRESNPDARGMLVAPAASEKVKRTLRDHNLEFVPLTQFSVSNTNLQSTSIDDF